MQIPDAVTIMGDPYPGVPGDDILLHGEDGAPVVVYPGHLVGAQPHHAAGQDHVTSLWHSHVLYRLDSQSSLCLSNSQPQHDYLHAANKVRSQPTRLHLVP